MAQYDASNAQVHIFTFKEGMLSAMAHDLQLKATRFTITDDVNSIRAEVQADSLKVMHAIVNGKAAPDALGAFSFSEIEKNINRVVLNAKKQPVVTFVSDGISADAMTGALTLNGVTKPVQFALKKTATNRVATLTFDQRDFRIVPYSAMLGALKVQPQVRLEISIPLAA